MAFEVLFTDNNDFEKHGKKVARAGDNQEYSEALQDVVKQQELTNPTVVPILNDFIILWILK